MRQLLLVSVLTMASIANGSAQEEKRTEIGLGVGAMRLNITGGDTYFNLLLNEQYVAAAFYLSPTMAIRPSVALTLQSGGGSSFKVMQLGASLPIYKLPTWGRSGIYYAPRLSVILYSADAIGSTSGASQFSLGASLGKKIPILDDVSVDISGSLDYWFSNDRLDDLFELGAHLGLSIFFP